MKHGQVTNLPHELFNRLLRNYIHDNPVKYGYVRCPRDWVWSSFHRWVRVRVYPSDWACWSGGHPPLSFADIEGSVGDFDANP